MSKLKVIAEQDGIFTISADKPKRPDLVKRNAKASNLDHEQIMRAWYRLRIASDLTDGQIDKQIADTLNVQLKADKKAQITHKAIEQVRLKLQTKDDPFSDPRYE